MWIIFILIKNCTLDNIRKVLTRLANAIRALATYTIIKQLGYFLPFNYDTNCRPMTQSDVYVPKANDPHANAATIVETSSDIWHQRCCHGSLDRLKHSQGHAIGFPETPFGPLHEQGCIRILGLRIGGKIVNILGGTA